MYIPPHFEEPSREIIFDLIRANPLGTLVHRGPTGLDANHVPFVLLNEERAEGVLHAHVARANPIWKEVRDGDEVLAIFTAGDAYVSPSWYPSKHEFKKQVPTWNYMVAHAHGRITVHDDERYVRGIVARLTRHHEARLPKPWRMTDSPKDYIDAMIKAVVGIEIEITRLTGKSKLSQNREMRDRRNAGEVLISRGEQLIGEAMIAATRKPESR
ncbi:FMN-binding negative transcriptional regulator [Rhizobium multihospitium]|uniref:Negative transcriptional regulator, PaiB family n=1 Tax=Rhizobium multihospitium TaxID=410764 RepID=A0A1C3XDT6_9HYPH|nr:FMN-binding negative transcriptional regulator [Rhizobium multihospitium]SCB50432.1 negative transcriptional regulator, PaiB family [Rhizobium multihospitium]